MVQLAEGVMGAETVIVNRMGTAELIEHVTLEPSEGVREVKEFALWCLRQRE